MHPQAFASDYGYWPSRTRNYKYTFPNRVWKLCDQGRIKQRTTDPRGRGEDAEHTLVFYLDIRDALRVVYAGWPKDGARKHSLLVDTVGPFWRWQQTATIDEIYITLVTFDI